MKINRFAFAVENTIMFLKIFRMLKYFSINIQVETTMQAAFHVMAYPICVCIQLIEILHPTFTDYFLKLYFILGCCKLSIFLKGDFNI